MPIVLVVVARRNAVAYTTRRSRIADDVMAGSSNARDATMSSR